MSGLRLRVKGESQQANVHAFLDTLPSIITSEEKIRLTFDRGYGKMDFIVENARKRYNISTIATTLGSRHPFVTKKESDKYIQDCQAKGELSIETKNKVELYSNWIGDQDDLFGSGIRIAKRELEGAPTIYAYAMNEVFDPKVSQKLLRFF